MLVTLVAYSLWTSGHVVIDGSHDLGRNGIWIQHGWLGDDGWFARNGKKEKIPEFRDQSRIRQLAAQLRRHGITDIFPHLCPTSNSGEISPVDAAQTERLLDAFDGFRVMPWVGGVAGKHVFLQDAQWRSSFARSIRKLLEAHPRFAGVHLNIEPCRSGDSSFLFLLDEVRAALPEKKVLSIAAYPPPTLLHPLEDVHWSEAYYKEVALRSDQLVVMMYDTAIRYEKIYRWLMGTWTREVLEWSHGTEVLLGVPAYRDEGVAYHDPKVENLKNALEGVHSGLDGFGTLPGNYRGIAVYCEWEMDEGKWAALREGFLRKSTSSASH